jgi:hypothetical protein
MYLNAISRQRMTSKRCKMRQRMPSDGNMSAVSLVAMATCHTKIGERRTAKSG